jgi:hypothetical protein
MPKKAKTRRKFDPGRDFTSVSWLDWILQPVFDDFIGHIGAGTTKLTPILPELSTR